MGIVEPLGKTLRGQRVDSCSAGPHTTNSRAACPSRCDVTISSRRRRGPFGLLGVVPARLPSQVIAAASAWDAAQRPVLRRLFGEQFMCRSDAEPWLREASGRLSPAGSGSGFACVEWLAVRDEVLVVFVGRRLLIEVDGLASRQTQRAFAWDLARQNELQHALPLLRFTAIAVLQEPLGVARNIAAARARFPRRSGQWQRDSWTITVQQPDLWQVRPVVAAA
jgi:hypothetical protein